MKTLKIVIIVLNMILLIHSIHFGLFAILPFLLKKKDVKRVTKKKHKFLILIAARNEEMVLGKLINSIKKQTYDKNYYKICVMPNNCTDDTKQIALNEGCMILEPKFKTKTKGEVLNYAFECFKNDNSFDTYIIFDADNVLDRNFLVNINDKLNEGYKVVQGFRDSKNLYENAITGSYGLFFFLQSLFVYEARSRMGESSSINGTGYAVLKDYINKINYRAITSTEDIELTCVSAINHEKIGYQRSAIFYDEQVTNFFISMKQRKRWIQGSMQVLKYYMKDLFYAIKEKNSFQLIEMFFVLTLPINQSIALFLLIISYIFFIPLPIIILGILIGYIGEVCVSIFLTIYFKKSIKKLMLGILFFPIFHLSWLPIYIYSMFNTKNVWEEIKHTKALDISEMLEK